jgi:hypothetical protein
MSNELFEYGGDVYVPIETAKLLKEAGFNWRVLMTYRDGVMTHQQHCLIDDYNHKMYQAYEHYSAPSLYTVQKWLREVKHIYVEVNIYPDDNKDQTARYGANILRTYIATPEIFKTYEEALLYGINIALKNIENKHYWMYET